MNQFNNGQLYRLFLFIIKEIDKESLKLDWLIT